MKTKIIILLAILMLMGCRSRKKNIQLSDYRFNQVEKVDTNTVVSTEKKAEEIKKTEQIRDVQLKENTGDITVTGQTDSIKDFRFHNIVAGDTLSDIYISGKASFIIKNRWKQEATTATVKEYVEKVNAVAEIARKSVAQSTIKEVSEEIKKKDLQLKSKGFPVPVYLIAAGAVFLLILLWFAWNKFGGKFIEKIYK